MWHLATPQAAMERRFHLAWRASSGILALVLASGACTSDRDLQPTEPPAAITTTSRIATFTQQQALDETRETVVPMVELNLTLDSASVPSGMPSVRLSVRGLSRGSRGTLRLDVPEVQSMSSRAWQGSLELARDTRVPEVWSQSKYLAAGESYQHSVQLEIPRFGRYRVVASFDASDNGAEQDARGRVYQPIHRVVKWLVVSPTGTRLEEPGRSMGVIGPFSGAGQFALATGKAGLRAATQVDETANGIKATSVTRSSVNPALSCPSSQYLCSWAGFYDADLGTYRAIPFHQVTMNVYGPNFDFLRSTTLMTGSDGWANFTCDLASDEWAALNATHYGDGTVYAPQAFSSSGAYLPSDCGTVVVDAWGDDDLGKAITNLQSEIVPNSRSIFGFSRSVLAVSVEPPSYFSSSGVLGVYSPSTDGVALNRNIGVWGRHGWNTQAHEYGHALHNSALGGFSHVNYSCPNIDYGYQAPQSLGCAFVEGFAEFHFAVTAGSHDPDGVGKLKGHTAPTSPNIDGSVVPYAVGGFLYDVVDADNAGHDIWVAQHDSLTYPAHFVADLYRTCTASTGGAYSRADGIDHIIHCMEGSVDPAITGTTQLFPSRSPKPVAVQSTVSFPYDPNRVSHVRRTWKAVLYCVQGCPSWLTFP